MARIDVSFSAPGVTNDIIAVLYKQTAPGVEVDREINPGNVADPWNFSFTDVEVGTYAINIHESPDGVTLGNLRHDFWVDSGAVSEGDEWIFKTTDAGAGHPVDGATTFDLGLPGREIKAIHKEGYGPLEPGVKVDIADQANIQLLGGDVFTSGEVWTIILKGITTATPAASGGGFTEFVFKTATTTLVTGELGKRVMVSDTGDNQMTTLPLLSLVQDGQGYVIQHNGGNLINVDVLAAGSDVIRFRGQDVARVYLGTGEWVKIIRATDSSAKWYVVESFGNWDNVGRRVLVDALGDNMIQLDGLQYVTDVYKRIGNFVTNLPPAQQVTESAWLTSSTTVNGVTKYHKRGFYAVDNIAGTFRVPDMQGMTMRGIKNVGSTDTDRADNSPGGYQGWAVGDHYHEVGTEPSSGSDFSKGTSHTKRHWNTGNTNNTGLSSTGDTYSLDNAAAGETRTENIGGIWVVLI